MIPLLQTVAVFLLLFALPEPHPRALADLPSHLASAGQSHLLANSLAVVPPSPTDNSFRQRLRAVLANPDVAVLVAGSGVLLLFVECNLPGAILPGALGLLLLLSGTYGLLLCPLRPGALLALYGATASLALSFRTPLRGIPAAAGTLCLIYGLWTLIGKHSASPRVRPLIAVGVGLTIGLSASFLGLVAGRARRNKSLLVPI